ncbi:MAG: extracellular solute-binding protein [Ktedonobacteraceae bacterium]|nr:extracellular solute-binding protein [Ktedonobacteraceae bacterium]
MVNEDSMHRSDDGVSRRRFIQMAASATVGSALLAACGGDTTSSLKPAPVATTLPQNQIDATVTASVGKTYFPGGPHVPEAYTVPPPAYQTVKYIPGSGQKVRAFEIFFAKPSVPKAQNKFWQELNKRLNVDWEVIQVVSDDYDTKAALQLQSGTPVDLFYISGGPIYNQAMQQGAFNDLTPYLTGNALKDYPNLARIAPAAWENSKYQGKIYGVPRSRTELPNVLMYHQEWADKLGLAMPQNPDEFFKWMVTMTKSNITGKKVYGFGGRAFFGTNGFVRSLYGVPNEWRVESNGSFTNAIETDEFKQALDLERRLWAAGIYHPDAPTANNKQSKTGFEAGQYASYMDGPGAMVAEQRRAKVINPKADIHIMVPMNNQGKVTRYLDAGYLGTTGIPTNATTDPERIKELLRILDYLTAPVFSVENQFLTYGISGWDSSVGKNGLQQVNDRGLNEIGELVGLASPPQIYYMADDPQHAVYLQQMTKQMVDGAVPNPSWGLSSTTNDKLSLTLSNQLSSDFARIVRGQAPLSELSNVIKRWNDQGGAKIKQEFADSYSKLH